VQVHQEGVACHTGARTCFFTRVAGEGPAGPRAGAGAPDFLDVLERTLISRRVERPEGSYVARLFDKGEAFICRKIGEEATEVVTAALSGESEERVISEVADLWFHAMVLLTNRGIPLRRVVAELERRHAGGSAPAGGVK
jgi:phosphoribosyl-ATP pyrophosphohydrolase/phosphoribosyl-AMP cyclohydrolase